VQIDDAKLQAWFETVKENYKSEPRIKLNYLAFTYEEIGRKITIDTSKIEEYYRNNVKDFQVPEQRHARHILLSTREEDSAERHQEQAEKAEEIRKIVSTGKDFGEVAKEYSEGPSKEAGGDLGFFSAGQMVPAFDQAVFTMQPGEISEVVKTQFGYHIIKLEEIQAARTSPLAEVTDQVKTILQRKEAENLAFQVANDAYEAIIGAGSLAKYAETSSDAPIIQTDFFAKSNAPAALKTDMQFLEKAFELNKGELSSLIKGQTGYAILFAEDVKEPEIPPFESIRDIVVKDYQEAQAKILAETSAGELLKNLHEGKTIDAAADEMGLSVLASGFINQNEQNGKTTFPSALVGDALLLSTSSPFPEKPGKVGDDFFVYSYIDRQVPDLPDASEEIEQYRQNLLRTKQQQLLSAWLRHQELNAKITRHPSL
jgi:peptidyl-prolyl cis-trans isomerase D